MARDVIYGAIPLFLYALRTKQVPFSQNVEMTKPLLSLIKDKTGESLIQQKVKSVDLMITFVDQANQETMIKNIPTVRVIYK
jgi:hypothetical protein